MLGMISILQKPMKQHSKDRVHSLPSANFVVPPCGCGMKVDLRISQTDVKLLRKPGSPHKLVGAPNWLINKVSGNFPASDMKLEFQRRVA